MRWPWPWPNDLDTQTWPRYGQDVTSYQKWSFYVNWFKSYSSNRQTDRHTHKHTDRQTDTTKTLPLPHKTGGNNTLWWNYEEWHKEMNTVNIHLIFFINTIQNRTEHLLPNKNIWQKSQVLIIIYKFMIPSHTVIGKIVAKPLARGLENPRMPNQLTCGD